MEEQKDVTEVKEVVKVPCKICKVEYDKDGKDFNQFISVCRPCLPRFNLDQVVCFLDVENEDWPTLGKITAAYRSPKGWRYTIEMQDDEGFKDFAMVYQDEILF